jgi:hypothetical protein
VQVDPVKPVLKAPGTQRLKLELEKLLSNFGFKFNLRRYTPAALGDTPAAAAAALPRLRHFAAHNDGETRRVAAKLCGVLAPALGRAVQLNPIKPTLNAPSAWSVLRTRCSTSYYK